jgi:putative ABC transport system ATP-binding protein
MSDAIIRMREVKKTYRLDKTIVEALRGADLEVERGAFVTLMGPSGSGKSSLLHIIGAMDRPSAGSAVVDGVDIAAMSDRGLRLVRARAIGFVFQAFHLNPVLNARDNVLIALRVLGMRGAEAGEKTAEALDMVGLSGKERRYPEELSGGERQRVAIARAIVKAPKLLLADEPTGNLDSERGSEIIGLLRAVNRARGTTVVLVTHDLGMAGRGDAIFHMKDGRIVGKETI